MAHSRYSGEEIANRGRELYDQRIRTLVETDENIGKIVSIDIVTGDFEIGDDLIATGDRLFARHPRAAIFGVRIGYNAVYAVGGSLVRTS